MSTVQEQLDACQLQTLADMLRKLQFGTLVSGMVPRRIARTGLASGATHVEPEAGAILVCSIADDAALTMIEAGTAGAGEVLVEYDAEGVATLTFGDGAQTAYRVVKMVLPSGSAGSGLASELAADSGAST